MILFQYLIPEIIIISSACLILVLDLFLKEDYKYELIIREINIKNNIEQKDDIIIEINRLYTEILEGIIKKYPEQYFWFHKKWDKGIYKNL